MASAAVTFGSFGDIFTIVQLVSELYGALGDIGGAPAEILALADDLNSHILVLPHVQTILLSNDSQFEPETRAGIERGLKRCKETLLALQRSIDPFTARFQLCVERRRFLAYLAAARWRIFGGRKEVALLHARLEKQLSFVQMCLGVSQSYGQRALHDVAKRNGVVAEQILLMVHSRPPPIDVAASLLQLYDKDTKTSYQAFAAVPLSGLREFLEPLTGLTVKWLTSLVLCHCSSEFYFSASGNNRVQRFRSRGRPVTNMRDYAEFLRSLELDYDTEAYVQLVDECGNTRVTTIFQCTVFRSESGEQHALLGVPPSWQKDFVVRILTDVIRGEFPRRANAGEYAGEIRRATLMERTMRSYRRILDLAIYDFRLCIDIHKSVLTRLERFPDPNFLDRSMILRTLEDECNQPYEPQWESSSSEHSSSPIFDVLDSAPRIDSITLTPQELNGIQWALRYEYESFHSDIDTDTVTIPRHDPIATAVSRIFPFTMFSADVNPFLLGPPMEVLAC